MRPGSLGYVSSALAVLTVLALLGCGPKAPGTTSLPDAALRTWFDNSLHLDLENERFWGRQDEETLLRQLGHADVVAVGSIESIGLASHYGAERHLNLAFRPEELLHGTLDGELDRDRQLVVRIPATTEAFEIARRLPEWNGGLRFLLLLKRAHDDARELCWAIYLPPSRLLAQVRTLFARLPRGSG
jgi:predicted small lipoprotein YifL